MISREEERRNGMKGWGQGGDRKMKGEMGIKEEMVVSESWFTIAH